MIKPDTANSPEEVVGMCGVLGYAEINKANPIAALDYLRPYASHKSWRIREAVAMAIQVLAKENIRMILRHIRSWVNDNGYEQRAVIAGFCEPVVLVDESHNQTILKIIREITENLDHNDRLNEPEIALRKALAYGWSVFIVASPTAGKKQFEALFDLTGKHIKWIIKQNLKKNRLLKLDPEWVEKCQSTLID
ncbi:hypothetical protein [Gracilimonas mengyeensis]|nr:hypothetical protein [Gracilimonas mengyeensis]